MSEQRRRRNLRRPARAPRRSQPLYPPFFEPIEALESRRLLAGDGRPIAILDASDIPVWSSTYTFRVAYIDDQGMNLAMLDNNDLTITSPSGASRNAVFYRSIKSLDGKTALAFYKISAPGGVWDASDNGVYAVTLNAHQVRDNDGNSVRSGVIGTFAVTVPNYPSTVAAMMPQKGLVGVDVTRFGAIPNDGRDDTEAIQRAIDSLPRDGDGVPDGENPIGGAVLFPSGTFNTDRPLEVPTAVVLRGQGNTGNAATVIANSSGDRDSGAVELMSYSSHTFNINAGVENLRITTAAAKGVMAIDLPFGDVIGLRLRDVTISAGGVAIDMRLARTYDSDFRNVTIEDPGSTALWIGPPDDWVSAINRINGMHITGTARPGFAAEKAMVVITGDVTIDGLTIADTGAPVTPLWTSAVAHIENLRIDAVRNLPGGVIARFEGTSSVDIDRLSGLGPNRKLDLIRAHDVRIDELALAPGARLVDSATIDGTSHLSVKKLGITTDPGPLVSQRYLVREVAPATPDPGLPWYGEPKRPAGNAVIDVAVFGARPDDGIDDTLAIQRAIDWLPRSPGSVPGGHVPVGGLVLFGAGRYDTSAPLLVPSGVWLRGQGTSTTINNSDTNRDRGAIEFIGAMGNGFNMGAAIEDLGIHTDFADGIRADPLTIRSALVDLRIVGVQVSAGDRGIDLSTVRTYHAVIENVIISNPGSTALWLGDEMGYSADNRVSGLQLQGTARNNFRPEKALVVLGGVDTVYENGWIEQPAGAVLRPLHVSGSATIRGLWLEYPPENVPDGIVVMFENTSRVDVDRLLHIGPSRRVHLVNAKGVTFKMLNLDGTTAHLRDVVGVDSNSHLSIGMVNAQLDSGMLDHPRISVTSAYNSRDRVLLQNVAPAPGTDMVRDPSFTTINLPPPDSGHNPGWLVTWGDQLGAVNGTVTLEQSATGPRLKVVINSNPNNRAVALRAHVNVPAHMVGEHGVARWRADASRLVLVYNHGYANQYSARAINGLTSARTPVPLRASEELIFLLPSAAGTYYISNVSLAPL